MHQSANPHRFTFCGDPRRGWNDMEIGRVRNNILFRNRRRHFVFEPIKTHALGDRDLVQHSLIGHWSPTQGKIDWHKRRLPIPAIDFTMQHPRIDRKMCQRFELKTTVSERRIAGCGLLRIGRNQNTGRIFDWTMQIVPTKDHGRERSDTTKELHRSLLSRIDAGHSRLHHHSAVNTHNLAGDITRLGRSKKRDCIGDVFARAGFA